MKTDSEGIVLRETKISYNRRMISLFTKEYGKISAGTNIGERGKTKSSLGLQPFTFGNYSIHSGRGGYNIDAVEVKKSFYGIGEDVDKYYRASYVLEFTSKVLEEEVPVPAVFNLMREFFEILEKREKGFSTLVLAYQTKLMAYLGVMPVLDRCVICGKAADGENNISIADGGLICDDCLARIRDEHVQNSERDALIYCLNFDIITALRYFKSNSLKRLTNIALKEEAGKLLQKFIRDYAAYHLDASNIKSEKLF